MNPAQGSPPSVGAEEEQKTGETEELDLSPVRRCKSKPPSLPFSVESLISERTPERSRFSPGRRQGCVVSEGTECSSPRGLYQSDPETVELRDKEVDLWSHTAYTSPPSEYRGLSLSLHSHFCSTFILVQEIWSAQIEETASFLITSKDWAASRHCFNYDDLFSLYISTIPRTPQSGCVQPTKTQEQQETQNSLHDLPAALSGEKVPSETVPLHRGESGVLQLSKPHRDTSQDLVSKPQGQGQETAGGRAGETEAGSEAPAAGLRHSLPPERTDGRTGPLRRLERPAARFTCTGTIQRSLWDVLPVLILTNFKRLRKMPSKRKQLTLQNVRPTHQKMGSLKIWLNYRIFPLRRKKKIKEESRRFSSCIKWNRSIFFKPLYEIELGSVIYLFDCRVFVNSAISAIYTVHVIFSFYISNGAFTPTRVKCVIKGLLDL